MARGVRRPGAAGLQRQELVADVDERLVRTAAAQLELEEAAVELERLVDVADLERDVVDPDEPSRCHGHIVADAHRCMSAARSYHHPVAETSAPVNEQLEEIGAQLSWVRDYL